jgi:dihydroorotase
MKIRIHSGRVIDPANNIDQVRDLFIDDSWIIDSQCAEDDFTADQTIDATGKVVCPGLVDLQARLREPGEEHKATMQSELSAAVAGGVTSVCVPPDTNPVIDTPAMVHMVRQRGRRIEKARVYPLGALTIGLKGEQLTDMATLRDAGCTAVSNVDHSIDNTLVMRRAMQYANTFDLTVFLTALDPWLKGNGCVHEGEVSTRLGLPAIPEAAEVVALARELALIETTGARGHITQLSCARSVDKIAEAKARGLNVTAAVSVHHLHLSEQDIGEFDTRCHVMPPLRSIADRGALREGLASGVIDAICSDHQPHGLDAKLAPFSESAPGIAGLETLLSLTLKLVDEGVLTLSEALARVTIHPARILNINGGQLLSGAPADICIFDPEATWLVDATSLQSRGSNTPFDRHTLRGFVDTTLVAGRIIYQRRFR